MHENREISSAPCSDDQGRSAKATSRTADTHVLEKSDCVVEPVNQPNKEGQPSAEAGEGSAQTKENIVQSHMHPTQTGKRMSQGLDGVRKAAKERKQERFTGQRHKSGTFTVWRITAKKRMVAKLKAIKAELQRRMHDRMAEVGAR
jgi:RNA-directed DNA polymerase